MTDESKVNTNCSGGKLVSLESYGINPAYLSENPQIIFGQKTNNSVKRDSSDNLNPYLIGNPQLTFTFMKTLQVKPTDKPNE